MKKKWNYSNLIIAVSLLLYVLSFTQVPFHYIDQGQIVEADPIFLLVGGAISILGGGLLEWLIWLANPFYLGALALFRKNKALSPALSFYATLIALSFLRFEMILVSESGREGAIVHIGLGYFLWVSSMAALFLLPMLHQLFLFLQREM
jgi:hypothetical protein